jgi:Flp pilus assembly protein TadG
MRKFLQTARQRALARSAQFGQRLARDEDGVTAIEFAMVGVPFFMMLFGIMGVGLYFFSVFNLENSIEQASRALRTGEWDKAHPITASSVDPVKSAKDQADSQAAFAQAVKDHLAGFFDTDKLRVQVVNVTAGTAPDVGQCLASGPDPADPTKTIALTGDKKAIVPPSATKFDTLGATQTMVVTACYQLDVLRSLPFIRLGNMPDGSTLISASVAFKTEPY